MSKAGAQRGDGGRMRRVNELLREVVGEAINDLDNPRLGFVTVTQVDTSPDLRSARVYISVLDESRQQESVDALDDAHGVLQAVVAAQTHMKRTPTLSFRYDDSLERGMRITQMLKIDEEEDEDQR